jgi:SAM-dependent methyltransferase
VLSNEVKNLITTEEFRVLDFGIGDGIELSKLGLPITDLIGIDTSPHILEFAKNNFKLVSGRFLVGNEKMLIQVPDQSVDLVVATNVLGYLTELEEMFFWEQVSRILVPNGSVLVTVGNKLFDLFALNSGTAEFFANELNVPGAGSLLTLGTTKRFKNARRHNPLSFVDSMRGLGFSLKAQSFSQWHHTPPAILERDLNLTLREARAKARDNVFDPNSLPLAERWRNYFQCSVVGLLFQRI